MHVYTHREDLKIVLEELAVIRGELQAVIATS
jgi:hypothetical protein